MRLNKISKISGGKNVLSHSTPFRQNTTREYKPSIINLVEGFSFCPPEPSVDGIGDNTKGMLRRDNAHYNLTTPTDEKLKTTVV
jgi:hypothetical protein